MLQKKLQYRYYKYRNAVYGYQGKRESQTQQGFIFADI